MTSRQHQTRVAQDYFNKMMFRASVVLLLIAGQQCHEALGMELVSIDSSKAINIVDEKFLSVAIDSHVVAERWRNFDFSDRGVLAMAAALAPAYLRLGGTAADLLVFNATTSIPTKINENDVASIPTKINKMDRESIPTKINMNETALIPTKINNYNKTQIPTKLECECDNYGKRKNRTKFIMTGDDWTKLNDFCRKVGWTLLFDANVLLRTEEGEWDSSNIQSLMDFSSAKGYADIAWELGNEPNSLRHALNVTLPPTDLGKDFAALKKLLANSKSYGNSTLVGPDVNGVARCFTPMKKRSKKSCKPLKYLRDVLSSSGGVMDAITWHHYYLDGHIAKLNDFLRLKPLNIYERTLKAIRKFVRKRLKVQRPLWLGETSSAFGGGAKGLSDRYVAGFLWLDKLGMSAAHGHELVIRQTFYHGCYAMIGEDLRPNPDFWLSLVYKKIVGRKVLKLIRSRDKSNRLRLFAHCSNRSGVVVLFGSNMSSKHKSFRLGPKLENSTQIRHYIFSPGDGGLTSRKIELNGEELKLGSAGEVPEMKARITAGSETLSMKPYEMAFWQFDDINIPACE